MECFLQLSEAAESDAIQRGNGTVLGSFCLLAFRLLFDIRILQRPPTGTWPNKLDVKLLARPRLIDSRNRLGILASSPAISPGPPALTQEALGSHRPYCCAINTTSPSLNPGSHGARNEFSSSGERGPFAASSEGSAALGVKPPRSFPQPLHAPQLHRRTATLSSSYLWHSTNILY